MVDTHAQIFISNGRFHKYGLRFECLSFLSELQKGGGVVAVVARASFANTLSLSSYSRLCANATRAPREIIVYNDNKPRGIRLFIF